MSIGLKKNPIGRWKRREPLQDQEATSNTDAVAEMLGGSEETKPPVDPDNHPKRQRGSS